MKRILFCVLLSFVTYSARAESWMLFSAAAVEDSINTMVEPEYRAATADEYEKQMDSTTGKITASGILSVCATAGWAINTDEGFYFCRGFVDNIAELSGVSSNAAKQCKQMNGIRTVLDDGSNQCIGRDGTVLVYSNACRGGDGECVEFFADLRTQVPNALEFIYEYGKSNNLKFTCSNEIVDIHKIGSDYIKCSANKTAYEFKFDTLNQSYNRRMVDSENAALCKMFGGTVTGTDDYWTMCDMERTKCDKLATFAPTIGHSAMYQGSCRISRTVNTRDNIFLNHIDGVDSYVFYDVKIRSGVAKPMLEQYLTSIFPDEEYITCDSDIVELNDPTSLGTNWIMQCTVGTQQVDFIFDELATQSDAQTMTGMDIMQCIINGGTFNGETCRGLTATECDALDAKLRASGSENGAYYDDDMRACVLGNAMATYQRNVVAGYVIGAVVIVGGTVLTIASGGAAAPVVINGVAMLAGDLAINYTIDANHRRLSEKAAKKFVNFVTDANACTTEQCALGVLEKHYATLSGVMSDLNTDDQAVVDETMDRLIGLIQTEFVACGKNDAGQTVYASPADCAMQQSHLKLMDYIDPVSEPVLIIGSILYNPGYVTSKFMKLKKVSKLAKLDDTTDAAVVAGSKIKNPKQWKPGEDVAEYMDVEKLQSKFDDIDKRHAAYLDELNTQLQDAEIRLSQTPKKTDAQSETAKIVKGQIDKRIEQLVAQEMDDFEEYNRIKNEFALQRKKITSEHREELIEILKEKGTTGLEDAINKYADSPEFTALSQRHKELSDKYRQIEHKIRRSSDDAELLKLKTEHDALVYGNSPKYNEVSNEIEYINALLEDAYKTIGDEKNVALWDAIPNEIKQKLPEIRDNEIVEILAKDDMLTHYVNNFDEVSKNAELYNDFLSRIARGVNDKHPMSIPVSIGTYTDADSPRTGALAQPIDNSIGINTARRIGTDFDGTIGIIKHEVGHSIDNHRANDGILGQTLQDMKTWKNHGNSDPDIMVAISPSGLNEFSVGDISRNARNQLESEGWKFENISTPETREKYLAEPTEKSSWSITPTSNIKQKVNSYRESVGVTQ